MGNDPKHTAKLVTAWFSYTSSVKSSKSLYKNKRLTYVKFKGNFAKYWGDESKHLT